MRLKANEGRWVVLALAVDECLLSAVLQYHGVTRPNEDRFVFHGTGHASRIWSRWLTREDVAAIHEINGTLRLPLAEIRVSAHALSEGDGDGLHRVAVFEVGMREAHFFMLAAMREGMPGAILRTGSSTNFHLPTR